MREAEDGGTPPVVMRSAVVPAPTATSKSAAISLLDVAFEGVTNVERQLAVEPQHFHGAIDGVDIH
jgi:hypothetical protein